MMDRRHAHMNNVSHYDCCDTGEKQQSSPEMERCSDKLIEGVHCAVCSTTVDVVVTRSDGCG